MNTLLCNYVSYQEYINIGPTASRKLCWWMNMCKRIANLMMRCLQKRERIHSWYGCLVVIIVKHIYDRTLTNRREFNMNWKF